MKHSLFPLIVSFVMLLFPTSYAFCQAVELPSLDVGVDPGELKKYDPDYHKKQGEPINESISEESKKDSKSNTSRYRELVNEREREIPARLKASPRYTVPNIDKKGRYGEAK